MSRALGGVRGAAFALLLLSAATPLLLLLAWSGAREWFWPALLPQGWSPERWAALPGGGSGEGGRLWRAAGGSLTLGVGTGILASLLGLPIGRALAELRGWRRGVGAAAAFLPVAAPPLAVAVGLQYSLLRAGLGGTLAGVMIAHLVPALGYASLFYLGVFSAFDARVEEVARTLGARRSQVLSRITLPLLRRPMIEAFVLGFLVSWAQVPLTLVVGQGVVSTLAVEILAYVRAGQDPLAATGALLLVLPPLGMMAAAGLAIRRVAVAP